MTDTATANTRIFIEPLTLEARPEIFEASMARAKELDKQRILIEIEGRDLYLVHALLIAMAENRGSTTPVERFVEDAVGRYVRTRGAIEPYDVQQLVDEFNLDFEDAFFIGKRVLQNYPERFAANPEAA